jgi:hypothetical protein
VILLVVAILLSGVAGAAMVLAIARFRSRRIVDAPHVRLHLVHEGSDTGDVTVEGQQTGERRDRAGQRWLVLHEAALLLPDGGAEHLDGETLIPVARVVFRQTIMDVRVGPLEVRA